MGKTVAAVKTKEAYALAEPVDPEIIAYLKASRIDGNNLYLPKSMPRERYQEVNEVLERIGGKWTSGRIKAHVFAYDPTETIAAITASGLMPEKNPTAFFPTPVVVVDQMLNMLELTPGFAKLHPYPGDNPPAPLRILEPSAGQGAIIDRILTRLNEGGCTPGVNYQITGVEMLDLNAATLTKKYAATPGVNIVTNDFVTYAAAVTGALGVQTQPVVTDEPQPKPEQPPAYQQLDLFAVSNPEPEPEQVAQPDGEAHLFDFIIMNPPFTVAGDNLAYVTHIKAAFDLLKPGRRMAAITPLGWRFQYKGGTGAKYSNKRVADWHAFFARYGKDCEELPEGTFKESGTGITTCIVVLEKPHPNWSTDRGYNGWVSFSAWEAWLYATNDSTGMKAVQAALDRGDTHIPLTFLDRAERLAKDVLDKRYGEPYRADGTVNRELLTVLHNLLEPYLQEAYRAGSFLWLDETEYTDLLDRIIQHYQESQAWLAEQAEQRQALKTVLQQD